MSWLVFCANWLARRMQHAMKQMIARLAGKSGLNHPLTWSFGEISREGKQMTKTDDFFLEKIATLALDTQFDTELAKRHALEAKRGLESHLEALETALCNIKRNADELLYLFRCLKVAKWEAEQEEEKTNGEN